jgi:peptide/nickel transport system substrate-binding protein
MSASGTFRWGYPIYESLLEWSSEEGGHVPRLAESWEVTPDGLHYTFHLREDVQFHDGTPFDAAAVVDNIMRQIDENHPGRGTGEYRLARAYLAAVEDVTALDEYTVQFTLSDPVASLLDWLTTPAGWMISPAAITEYGDDLATNPVGTGPFKFVEYRADERLVMQANDDYWGGRPEIDNLVFLPIVDAQARVAALEAGTAHFVLDVAPDVAEELKADPGYALTESLTPQIWFLALNQNTVPIFEDKRVRQAMNYAVDKRAIVDDVLKGSGVVAASQFSEVFGDWYDPTIEPYPYDPDRARELLAEAGYADGFEVTILTCDSGFAMQSPVDMVQVIQANLASVGITTDIEIQEFASYWASYSAGEFEVAARAWYANQMDPDNYLINFFHSSKIPLPERRGGLNVTAYVNPEVDRLIDEARVEPDHEKRVEMVHEVTRIIVEDAPWVFIDHMIDQHAGVANLGGVKLLANGMVDFEEATLAP